jgi:hypothetical protein
MAGAESKLCGSAILVGKVDFGIIFVWIWLRVKINVLNLEKLAIPEI